MSNNVSGSALAIPQSRIVNFGESLDLFFRNYFAFNSRSSRGAYWWATLWLLIFTIGMSFGDVIFFATMYDEFGTGPLGLVLSLVTLVPSLSVSVRRLHDIGRSGWWVLITFTIIGIIPLIWWASQPGQRKENAFGPDHEAGR